MGAFAAFVIKDLKRRLADPAGLILALMIPLVLAGLMGLAFGNFGGGTKEFEKLRAVVLDLDQTPLTTIVGSPPRNADAANHLELLPVTSREEGMRRMREDGYPALLVVPKGFTKSLLHGTPVQLEIVKNPAQRMMPLAAQQAAEVLALYLSVGSRVLEGYGPQLQGLFDGEESDWADSVALAGLASAVYARMKASDTLLFPPLIEVKEPGKDDSKKEDNGLEFMAWMYPGMIVMGLMFVGVYQMKDLLREREAGTLKRQLASPVGPGTLLAAKVASVAIIVVISGAIMMLLGSAAFRITWGPPGLMAAAVLMASLAVTGFSALIYALVRTERQGDALGGIITMVMSMLGGAFVPVEAMPQSMQRIAKLSLNYWANGSLKSLSTVGGQGIGVYLAALAVIAAVCISAGMIILSRRHLRGAL